MFSFIKNFFVKPFYPQETLRLKMEKQQEKREDEKLKLSKKTNLQNRKMEEENTRAYYNGKAYIAYEMKKRMERYI